MFVFSVNHKTTVGQAIISNASCAPPTAWPRGRVLRTGGASKRSLMTHRARPYRHAEDRGRPVQQDWRGVRGILENIIPSSTSAAKAVGVVIRR